MQCSHQTSISPSRSALQSGRNPYHVNNLNAKPDISNPDDPVSGFAGIPRNMTGIATKLKAAGYATAAFGAPMPAPPFRACTRPPGFVLVPALSDEQCLPEICFCALPEFCCCVAVGSTATDFCFGIRPERPGKGLCKGQQCFDRVLFCLSFVFVWPLARLRPPLLLLSGKWDAGMATPEHTPRGRGYDTSLIYYHHDNDYWCA
jgi:hypothetical protein